MSVSSGLRPNIIAKLPSVARSRSIGSTFAKNLIFLPAAGALYCGCDLRAS